MNDANVENKLDIDENVQEPKTEKAIEIERKGWRKMSNVSVCEFFLFLGQNVPAKPKLHFGFCWIIMLI